MIDAYPFLVELESGERARGLMAIRRDVRGMSLEDGRFYPIEQVRDWSWEPRPDARVLGRGTREVACVRARRRVDF